MTSNLFPWGQGDPIPGTPFRVVIPADATGGRAVGIAAEMPPGEHVDEHTHDGEEQICIVVSGRLRVRVGDTESVVEAGGVQVLPRGVPHELWNAGDEPVKLIDLYTPPGIEVMFTQIGAAAVAREGVAADADHRSDGQ